VKALAGCSGGSDEPVEETAERVSERGAAPWSDRTETRSICDAMRERASAPR